MYPAAAGRLVYGPDSGADSSFPERHFLAGDDDDKAVFSDIIEPSGPQPIVTRQQTLESNFSPFSPQGWSNQNQQFPHRNHVRYDASSAQQAVRQLMYAFQDFSSRSSAQQQCHSNDPFTADDSSFARPMAVTPRTITWRHLLATTRGRTQH